MSKKSQFLKSAKLAIAGIILTSGVAACGMLSDKHKCSSKNDCSSKVQEGKSKCSANGCSAAKK
ncbi:MAG: hypothetical protein ACJAW3_001299 [Lentimonas sp.]|jgi:hypothetical protein